MSRPTIKFNRGAAKNETEKTISRRRGQHAPHKSDYVYLANYERITVDEIAELRATLPSTKRSFTLLKTPFSMLRRLGIDNSEHLSGPTAIIGGNNPSGVAKALGKFFKDKEKVELKVGILDNKTLDTAQIEALAKLPGLESLRAQLLGLL